ncbi:MAG: hypothetical protein ACI8RN_000324 [Glaciecola sp.]
MSARPCATITTLPPLCIVRLTALQASLRSGFSPKSPGVSEPTNPFSLVPQTCLVHRKSKLKHKIRPKLRRKVTRLPPQLQRLKRPSHRRPRVTRPQPQKRKSRQTLQVMPPLRQTLSRHRIKARRSVGRPETVLKVGGSRALTTSRHRQRHRQGQMRCARQSP